MLIGIDLDNTIINYETAFHLTAKEWGLIPPDFQKNRNQLKQFIKNQTNGHETWMRLQGYIYGQGIERASIMQGFEEFIALCRKRKMPTVIVSHKTKYGHFAEEHGDLREAALNWLEQHHFFDDFGFVKDEIFFETTQELKIQRILDLNCTHFIDDLVDIFAHDNFPKNIKSFLINTEAPSYFSSIQHCLNWHELVEKFFCR